MKKLMTLTVGSLCAFAIGAQSAHAAMSSVPTPPPAVQEVAEDVDYEARLDNARVRFALLEANFAECKTKAQSSGYYDAFDMKLSKVEGWLEQISFVIDGCKEVLSYPPSEAVDRDEMLSYLESLLFEAESDMSTMNDIDVEIAQLKNMDAAADLFSAYCTSRRYQMLDARPPEGCSESDEYFLLDKVTNFLELLESGSYTVREELQRCHEQISYGADIITVAAEFNASIARTMETLEEATSQYREALNSIWFEGGVENAQFIMTDELRDALTEACDFLQLFVEQMAEDLEYSGENDYVQSQYENVSEHYQSELDSYAGSLQEIDENIAIFNASTEFETVEVVVQAASIIKSNFAYTRYQFGELKEQYASDLAALCFYRDTWQKVESQAAQIAGLFTELQNLREDNASNAAFISKCDEFENECEVLEADNLWLGTDLTSKNYQLDEYSRNLYESRLQQSQHGIAQARVHLEDLQQKAEAEQGEIAELAAAKAEVIEFCKMAVARAAETRSRTEGNLTIPMSLADTSAGNRLQDIRLEILAILDNNLVAPVQALYEQLRQDVANQTLDTMDKCAEYRAHLSDIEEEATVTFGIHYEQWQQLMSLSLTMVETKGDLAALAAEIQAAIDEVEGMLEAGRLPTHITEILHNTLTDYRALFSEVESAIRSVDDFDCDLGNNEYITDAMTVTLNGLCDQADDLRSRFAQARQEYREEMETQGFHMQFNANTFFAKVTEIINSIDRFVLYLNNNLTDGDNFSDHFVFTQGLLTPGSHLYGLFWQYNNEAQAYYTQNYTNPAYAIMAACNEAASNGTLSERADECLAQLYRLQYEASAYEQNWRSQMDQYGEIPWMIAALESRFAVVQDRIANFAAYLGGLTVPESDYHDYVQSILNNTIAEVTRLGNEATALQNRLNNCQTLDGYDEIGIQLGMVEENLEQCISQFGNSFANMPDAAPVGDASSLYAAYDKMAQEISDFLSDLTNVLMPPAEVQGTCFYSEMMERNSLAQLDARALRDALAKERTLLDEAVSQGRLNAYAVEALDVINDKMWRLTEIQSSFYNEWSSMATDAKRYITLRKNVSDYRAENAAYQAQVAEYALLADGNSDLLSVTDLFTTSYNAVEQSLNNIESGLSNMQYSYEMYELEERAALVRQALDVWFEQFKEMWAENGGPVPGSVTDALFAEFNALFTQARMLDAECKAVEAQISEVFSDITFCDEVSVGFVARLSEIVAMTAANGDRLDYIVAEGLSAQAAGAFDESYVNDLNAVIADYARVQAVCESIFADFRGFEGLFTDYNRYVAAAAAERAEIQEFAANATTDEYDEAIQAVLAAIEEIDICIAEHYTDLLFDWDAAAFQQPTLNDYQYYFAEPMQQLRAAMQTFWQEVKPAGAITISSLEAEYEMTVEYQIASKTETYREYDENFDFDVVKRCELYQSIVALFNARFSEDHRMLMAIDHAIRDCKENPDLLLLEGEDIMARLAVVRAEADAFRADFLAAMEQYADELAAEYALRSGATTDTTADDVVLYVDTYVVNAGDNVEVPIKLKSNVDIKGFQFDMEVPEGLVQAGSVPQYVITYTTTDRSEGVVFQTNYMAETSKFRVIGVMSSSDVVITAGDGAVVNLQIANVPEGNYPLVFTNVKLIDANNEFIAIDKVIGNVRAVTLANFGGADSTGSDIISDLATALGTAASDATTVDQNDITGDGEVSIGDITTAIRLLNEKQ
ncbi:MAG: cohesin domain-containing protein [Bacteroidales bacterium]|nr:cohesin domain-containing protein [Bacteroidales bacterium]